jgi:hypothetical protein
MSDNSQKKFQITSLENAYIQIIKNSLLKYDEQMMYKERNFSLNLTIFKAKKEH